VKTLTTTRIINGCRIETHLRHPEVGDILVQRETRLRIDKVGFGGRLVLVSYPDLLPGQTLWEWFPIDDLLTRRGWRYEANSNTKDTA
jgi:hypothetical protein